MVAVAYWKIERLRKSCRLHTHGKAADGKNMDIQKVDGMLPDEIRELEKVLPLSGRDRNARLLAQLGQETRIVVHDRFFEPHQIIRLKALTPPNRGVEFHQAVGIRHQFDFFADRFS